MSWMFRWKSGQPNNDGGNDLILLKEGCVAFVDSELRDRTCAGVYSFVCEYRNNKTDVSCPDNLFNDPILGCGWF